MSGGHYGTVIDGPWKWEGWHSRPRPGCEQCSVEFATSDDDEPVEWEPDEPERFDYTHYGAYGEDSFP